jgi:predicted dehydrogenase
MLNVLIVGAGSIGALKPDNIDFLGKTPPLTHAHAVALSGSLKLVGICDTDYDTLLRATHKWQVTGYQKLEEAVKHCEPDIVIVATPTDSHFRVMNDILYSPYHTPRLVIAEKPFCDDAFMANGVISSYDAAKIPIAVNYLRRFVPDYIRIANEINSGELGQIYHARLTYGRGLLRDGCHGIDLLHWFFGRMLNAAKLLDMFDRIDSHDEDDPTIAAQLQFEHCLDVHLAAINSRAYGIFELEIFTEKGRILFAENGTMLIRTMPEPEPIYGDYMSMPFLPQNVNGTNLTYALSGLIRNCVDHLNQRMPLICTAEDAIQVHESIDRIKGVKQ